ncbi:MAG: hypothetical protein FJ137_01730 [Deltaproteobacteria bacterium]|nr:hypothetical protein [Deltaproteobacteria bacterium]
MKVARSKASWVLVIGLSLAATAAQAYRPSTAYVLNRAMERSVERGTKTLKVQATVQVMGAPGAVRGESFVERVWIAAPGQLRRETDADDGMLVEIRDAGRTLTKTPGQPDKAGKGGVDVLLDTVAVIPPASAVAEQVLASLKALGINTELTSYARFDGRVAVLVGSKPWETDKPQAWFDKDTLLPVRLVTFAKGADGAPVKVDVRYLGWGSPVGGNWYPAAIELWRGDKLVRRSVTQSVERNVAVDASRFALR